MFPLTSGIIAKLLKLAFLLGCADIGRRRREVDGVILLVTLPILWWKIPGIPVLLWNMPGIPVLWLNIPGIDSDIW